METLKDTALNKHLKQQFKDIDNDVYNMQKKIESIESVLKKNVNSFNAKKKVRKELAKFLLDNANLSIDTHLKRRIELVA